MYLRKLYQQHKGWFVFIVMFIVSQLFINYKRGVVFSPFYHYGMYSSIMRPQPTYDVTEIEVNGKILQTKDFSPQQWDKIMLPVSMNDSQQRWNSSLYNTLIQRLAHAKDSSAYVNNYSAAQFQQWYSSYLETILGIKINSVNISHKTVQF